MGAMPTDFWGLFWVTILPNYIAAIGGAAATFLALYSLIISSRARSTARQAVASDADTRERTADLLEAIAQPLLASDQTIPSDTTIPSGAETLGEAVNEMDRARFDAMLRWLRNDSTTKDAPRADR